MGDEMGEAALPGLAEYLRAMSERYFPAPLYKFDQSFSVEKFAHMVRALHVPSRREVVTMIDFDGVRFQGRSLEDLVKYRFDTMQQRLEHDIALNSRDDDYAAKSLDPEVSALFVLVGAVLRGFRRSQNGELALYVAKPGEWAYPVALDALQYNLARWSAVLSSFVAKQRGTDAG